MRLSLTVVIPALDEERHLPSLLAKLASQTRLPQQIIVADAHSTDRTREIAEQAGALVVDGGSPAAGRNAGAAVANTDLLLFLDADVDPDPEWIQRAVAEFVGRGLVVAGTTIEPIESDAINELSCDIVNAYLQLIQYVRPHAPGFCILARREVHERIGGFDEDFALAEDYDYVRRAAKIGKFRFLTTAPMRTSMRRVAREGLARMAFIIVYSELVALSGLPMIRVPIKYEFGAYGSEGISRRTAAKLHARLRKMTPPAVTPSSEVAMDSQGSRRRSTASRSGAQLTVGRGVKHRIRSIRKCQ